MASDKRSDSHSENVMRSAPDLLDRLYQDARQSVSRPGVTGARAARKKVSRMIVDWPAHEVFAAVQSRGSTLPNWVGWEIIWAHVPARNLLTCEKLEDLGAHMNGWGDVDGFGSILAGPAWLAGLVDDADIIRWTQCEQTEWRRTALVATTVLNTRSRGGRGDVRRTLMIVDRLIGDRADLIVKAVSWSLRTLVPWAPEAVNDYLETNADQLHARVKREVRNKLDTGLKSGRKV